MFPKSCLENICFFFLLLLGLSTFLWKDLLILFCLLLFSFHKKMILRLDTYRKTFLTITFDVQ
jgi:hypothetical protein